MCGHCFSQTAQPAATTGTARDLVFVERHPGQTLAGINVNECVCLGKTRGDSSGYRVFVLPQSHLEAPQPQTNIIYCKLADLTSMCPAYEQRLKDCGAGPHSSKPHGDEICSRLCPPQRTGDNITIAEFVRQYGLNTEIERMLEQEGYHRMHAVKGIDVKDLPDMGFKKGHIAELKAAIDKWAKM